MLDFMLLFVELALTEKVVDCFVILRARFLDQCLIDRQATYDLEELTFHLVLPAFRPKVLSSSEHLVHGTGYHACRGLGLQIFVR